MHANRCSEQRTGGSRDLGQKVNANLWINPPGNCAST